MGLSILDELPKQKIKEVVEELDQANIRTIICTGDSL